MIKKYYQVVCNNCLNTIDNFHSYPSYQELKESGVVSKGKDFCDNKCKEEYFAKQDKVKNQDG